MMNNMFSMFDPSSYYLSSPWAIMLMITLTMATNNKNTMVNKAMKSLSTFKSFLYKEMNQLMSEKKNKYTTEMMVKLCFVVMTINLAAMVPFNFTMTAHISISMTTSGSMWMSIMAYGWMNNFKNMMAHLTPMGTPSPLMNFMVAIETMSNMIRPITLSVRLSANMVAGHLLMSLLSSFSMSSKTSFSMSMPFMFVLMALEMVVAIVQAYVIVTLMMLYQNESMQYDK